MPTYQYACTECGERSEVVQKFSDDPLTVCTVCGGRLRKVFSPVGIVFKGSGFYRTDSRAGANGSNGKSQADADSGAAKSGSGDSAAGEKPAGDKADKKTGAAAGSSSSGDSPSSSNGSSPAAKSGASSKPSPGSKVA